MVQIVTDIIVAVVAQVIADRLCKWLDNYRSSKHKEAPGMPSTGGFIFVSRWQ